MQSFAIATVVEQTCQLSPHSVKMDFSRLARNALSTSRMTMTTSTTLASRVFGATSPSLFYRSLSTTPMRLAPPRQSSGAWPPQREAATSDETQPAESQSQSTPPAQSSNPLKDMYSSENPAQWATWSSNDFSARNGLGGMGGIGHDAWNAPAVDKTKEHAHIFLGPRTGRTVHVGGGVDVARAFGMLEILAKRNKIKVDFQRQRFYERPGMKRKRVYMESWRRRFKQGFKATVSRVNQLNAQGW